MSYELRSKDMDRRQQAERPDPLNSSDYSQDDPDLAILATPDEENLLRTSPPTGESGGARAAPIVPLPGGAQEGAGSSSGRGTPTQLMQLDELRRMETECHKHNQAVTSFTNMLNRSTNNMKTRIHNVKQANPNGHIKPAVLETLKKDLARADGYRDRLDQAHMEQVLAETEGHGREDVIKKYQDIYNKVVDEFDATRCMMDELEHLVVSPTRNQPAQQDRNSWKCEFKLLPLCPDYTCLTRSHLQPGLAANQLVY